MVRSSQPKTFDSGIDALPALSAERELARRSPSGALLYFVAFLLTVSTTPYENDRPLFVLMAGAIVLVLGCLRLLGALRLRDATDAVLRDWIKPFRLVIYAQFALWGMFCAATVWFYQLIPATFLLLLYTVGLASGATTSLASDYVLGRRAIVLMIAPTMAPALAMRTTLGNVLAGVTALFMIFLMTQIKEHWESLREVNRAAALRAARETEERLREITANMGEVVWLYDALSGRVLYINQAFTKIWGQPPGGFHRIGEVLVDPVVPEDKDRVALGLERQRRGEMTVDEFRIRRPDGSVCWIRAAGYPVLDDKKITVRVAGTAVDITGEKLADGKRQEMTGVLLTLWRTTAVHRGALEESLQEITRVASDTLEAGRVSIWQPTGDRKNIRCLVLYERSLSRFSSGMELEVAACPSYFQQIDAHRTIAADDARTDPRTRELLENYIEPFQITSMMDSSIRLEDGQLGVIRHEHSGPPRRWSAEEQAFSASLGDLVAMTIMRSRQTEAEQHRRQAQKLEALGVLAGGIAHDFNNILAAINGFAELALREIPEDSKTHSRLEQILRAGGRAADLVRQILAFSSYGERPKEIVNVRKVIVEVMTMLRASIPASIEIVSNVKQEGHVLASVIEVQQILINLCTNSYHAMKETGRIEIGVDVAEFQHAGELSLAPGRYVCISVSDTGPGIDVEIRERIFDPFFTTKPVGHGTGLGLAVVHGIVRYHGGAVDVTSTPGKGACFSVYLPLCEGPDLDRTEPEVSVRPGDEHILFVDDEETLISLWKEILERNGYTVTCARNGQEALDLFQANPYTFDLVITDVTMPKMNGPDLARELFDLRPGMPIIMSTGYTDTMSTRNLRSLGIRGTLAKPCPSRLLLSAVRDALDDGN